MEKDRKNRKFFKFYEEEKGGGSFETLKEKVGILSLLITISSTIM